MQFFKQSKVDIFKSTKYFILGFALILSMGYWVRIVISETDSLPTHYFLHLPFKKPKYGDHTLVHSQWIGQKIIKKIIGVPGDYLWYDYKGYLWLNQCKIGFPYSESSDGEPLKAIEEQVIPPGYVFLYSPHPRSFDSRYQELDLVPMAQLQGWVIPLF